jgi:acyl-CoA thioesterase I
MKHQYFGSLLLRPSMVIGRLLLIAGVVSGFFSITSQAQIVALGASNVAGKGVSQGEAWPAQLEGMLKAKGYNVWVKNAGKSGDTTSGMLHRLNFAVPSGTKIVILDMTGGYHNNAKGTAATQARGHGDMDTIETQLKARGITVLPESTAKIPPAYRQADKVHLTAEGHKIMASKLLPRVMQALGSPT